MRVVLAGLLAVLGGICFSYDGWKRPQVIEATVTEKVGDAPERTLKVARTPQGFSVTTTQGIFGELEGTPRVEAISRAGIFTWLEGKPEVALQLLTPTSLNFLEYFETPRFSRGDLEFDLKGIERALKKRVLVGREEKIAGRECLVLMVLDRPDSMNRDYQKLWIDKETGMALKIQDYFRGNMTYQREFSAFDYGGDEEKIVLKPKEGATVIRGLVSGQSLIRVPIPRSVSDFKRDISNINSMDKKPEDGWATSLDVKEPFGYITSNFREFTMRSFQQMLQQQQAQQQAQSRGNLLGNGISEVPMQLFTEGGQATISVTTTDDGGRRYQVITESGTERREFVVARDSSGQIRFENPGSQGQRDMGSSDQQKDPDKNVFLVKSDFVDPKSGNTFTLLQVYGADPEPYLGNISLGQPTPHQDGRLSQAKTYTVKFPFTINVLVWRIGEMRYAIAATGLDFKQIADLAVQIKPKQESRIW